MQEKLTNDQRREKRDQSIAGGIVLTGFLSLIFFAAKFGAHSALRKIRVELTLLDKDGEVWNVPEVK